MDDSKKRELLDQLCDIVDQLGWVLAIPTEEGNDIEATGAIIGEEEFIYDVLDRLGVGVDVFTKDDNGEIAETDFPQGLPKPSNKKRNDYH